MRIEDLDTPALIIDLDIMEQNLRRMADYTAAHGLKLRPHTKTHKIPALGRRQVELGACGLTVAKTTEAEVMAAAEPAELLVAYPVYGRAKLERLVGVARKLPVMVSLDSAAVARPMGEAARAAGVEIGVLVEMDAGLGRVGVTPGAELVELCRTVRGIGGLKWRGIAFYPGHTKSWDEAGRKGFAQSGAVLEAAIGQLKSAGMEPEIVSGGSTPTWEHAHEMKGLTEVRPGTYIFNDRNTMFSGACTLEQCAASILVTVASTARPGQVIIDGGAKTFTSDLPAAAGYDAEGPSFGHVVEAPGAVFRKMNEEHGYVDIRRAGRTFEVGERVRVIPNHICVAMNMHETVYGVRGGQVEQAWRVEGRGKLQ